MPHWDPWLGIVHRLTRTAAPLSVLASSVFDMRDIDVDAGARTVKPAHLSALESALKTAITLPSVDEIVAVTRRLSGAGLDLDDAGRIDLIRALEELKCAAEGAQAEVTADFDRSQRAAAARRGEPAERQGRGIAHQVALARRESPHRGQRHVGLARILRTALPCTRAALRSGRITEWTAMVVARETACLSLEHRMMVDERLAGDPARIEAMGHRELVGGILDLSCRLDPAAVTERRRRAEADRHTTLRPAPDTMTYLSALLPVKDGVAVHKALLDEADRRKSSGDPRSRGAIMADTLVRRVLAPHIAGAEGPAELPLMIHVVVPDTVLLGGSDATGFVEGVGPVPGELLREWIASHAEDEVMDWVRRLYQEPATGQLVAMDKDGRRFDGRLADYSRLRDRRCRTRWCNAPIRHLDHADDFADGGATSAANAQGLCEACNHAKQGAGWSAQAVDAPVHTIEITTPTGHRYLSTVPTTGPPLWMEIYPNLVRLELAG
jgi:hypothetical protein